MAGRTLIIDTALGACTVLVAEGERTIARRSEIMARGHQERLGGLARDVIADAGGAGTIDRVAVTVGPGSFTGLRVGLAFAKGFGLALDIPVAGLGVLDALAESGGGGLVAAVIDARRDQVYLGLFRAGRPVSAPEAVSIDHAVERLSAAGGAGALTLIGTGANFFETAFPTARRLPLAAPEPEALARLAARLDGAVAAPLYLRPPDAKPPRARA